MEAHHVFVLPTLGENFGHAIFEALSAGRPVLISNKTPWLNLREKETGWDLSLEDEQSWMKAIVEAAGWDQEIFDRWSRKCRDFAQKQVERADLNPAYLKLFN
jgi:glycosyltransferase involved in cell wall biosynthesis